MKYIQIKPKHAKDFIVNLPNQIQSKLKEKVILYLVKAHKNLLWFEMEYIA